MRHSATPAAADTTQCSPPPSDECDSAIRRGSLRTGPVSSMVRGLSSLILAQRSASFVDEDATLIQPDRSGDAGPWATQDDLRRSTLRIGAGALAPPAPVPISPHVRSGERRRRRTGWTMRLMLINCQRPAHTKIWSNNRSNRLRCRTSNKGPPKTLCAFRRELDQRFHGARL